MELLFLWALAGLQIKHFVADYTLQWPSMIAGKCHLDRAGGYMHAGIHVLLTLLVLLFCNLPATAIGLILLCEFVIHYVTDYAKSTYDWRHKLNPNTRHFWMVHGADQMVHQLTYVAILAVIIHYNPA